MGYLLLISFILHLVGFYFLILLYQRQKHQKPFDKEKTMREMEDLLVAYTTEMKENNESLAKIVARERQKTPANVRTTTHHVDLAREDVLAQKNPNTKKIHAPIGKIENKNEVTEEVRKEEFKNYSPPMPEEESPNIETSPTSQVLSLYNQGLSEQEIAKELNMGAGEVELIIKMTKKLS